MYYCRVQILDKTRLPSHPTRITPRGRLPALRSALLPASWWWITSMERARHHPWRVMKSWPARNRIGLVVLRGEVWSSWLLWQIAV